VGASRGFEEAVKGRDFLIDFMKSTKQLAKEKEKKAAETVKQKEDETAKEAAKVALDKEAALSKRRLKEKQEGKTARKEKARMEAEKSRLEATWRLQPDPPSWEHSYPGGDLGWRQYHGCPENEENTGAEEEEPPLRKRKKSLSGKSQLSCNPKKSRVRKPPPPLLE
jgi:hypothetical protein